MMNTYIFDFGNVLAEFYPEKLTEPYVTDKNDIKYLSEVVFDRLYWDKLDAGTITDDEVKEALIKRLPENKGETACKIYDNWVKTLTPVPNMQEIVFDLHKAGKKLYLLSNISTGFANSYAEVEWIKELFDCFDGLVFSGVAGKLKPNKDIFEHLLKTYDLKAEECIFIDDSQKNIDGAKTAGISGYLFDGDAVKLRKFLNI